MPCIEIEKLNESYSRIYTTDKYDDYVLEDLEDYFTAVMEGAKFSNKCKYMGWDGKVKFFNANKPIISNGLISHTRNWCAKHEIDFKLSNFPELPDIDRNEFVEYNKQILAGTNYVPRDYQEEAAYQALNRRHGILECCTSSGKSLIIYLIIRNLLKMGVRNILLCVPNIQLVNQMYADFADYGWTDEKHYCEILYGGEKPTFEKQVLISTWQSLQNKERDFFEKFDAVIYDECHSSKAKVVNKILKACENSIWRIGTTGTLPTSKLDMLSIASVLGEVLYKITSKELIDRGVLTRMIIANIFVKYPPEFIKRIKGADYLNEVKEFEECDARQIAIDKIINFIKPDQNLLILVNHRDHLKKVADYISKKYKDRQVEIISGSVDAKKREKIRKDAEESEGLVIVATYGTCSTGVNIKKLHGIVLYGNSTSKIKVLQSLGRGLRKHSTKSKVFLFDVIDDCRYTKRTGNVFENRLYKQWLTRVDYYKSEEYPMKSLIIPVPSNLI